MIKIEGLTEHQKTIAYTLWYKCQSQKDVDSVLANYGYDARVVYEMMIAHTMDKYMHTDEAAEVLSRFRLN
jgi:hypothetical protein